MRKLLILSLFLPLMVLAQSSLPPCPETGLKHNCSGEITFSSGNKYVGEYRDGKPHGQGTVTFPSGNRYVGEFRDGKQNGQGSFTFSSGNKYVGEFRDGKMFGQGTFTFSNGDNYVGEFRDSKFFGKGVLTFASGNKYVGGFWEGKLNGEGISYRADGSVFRSGLWTNGDLTQSYALDTNRFPFNSYTQSVATSPIDPGRAERDRLAAELDAERKRRQALEDRLASEARERQRLASIERSRPEQTGDGTPDDQTCRRYGFIVATSPYANCRQQLDMARRQQEQYEQQVAAAEEEARRRRMREFGMRLLQGQQIGEAAMAASGMALPERPRPTSIISPQGPIVCQYYSASRSFVCQ